MTNPIQNNSIDTSNTEETLELDFDVGELSESASTPLQENVFQDNQLDVDSLNTMEEIDGDLLLNEMDDIEAELLALRQQLESETHIDDDGVELPMWHADEQMQPEISNDVAEEPHHNNDIDSHTTHLDASPANEPVAESSDSAEPAVDSFAAFAAEFLQEVESVDYGVNSQRFKPDDFDVASETAEIAPSQIDEDELETIDGSDLEALFGLHDDYVPNVGSGNSFLAEAAQLEEQDDLPNLLPESDDFSIDEITFTHDDNENENRAVAPTTHAPVSDESVDDIFSTLLNDVNQIQHEETVETVDVVDTVETITSTPVAQTSQTKSNQAVGLDLSDDNDDTMAWLDKIKNEMASKFDIDIDQEVQALSHNENTNHLYDNLEEFDDKQVYLGDNLNQLPEFDESSLSLTDEGNTSSVDVFLDNSITEESDEPVIRRPISSVQVGKSIEEVLQLQQEKAPEVREIDTNISLDDIWADPQSNHRKVDLTAAPLDEAEMELFDESMLDFGGASSSRSDEKIDLEMDFTSQTQPENTENDNIHADEMSLDLANMLDLGDDVVELDTSPAPAPSPNALAVDNISLNDDIELDMGEPASVSTPVSGSVHADEMSLDLANMLDLDDESSSEPAPETQHNNIVAETQTTQPENTENDNIHADEMSLDFANMMDLDEDTSNTNPAHRADDLDLANLPDFETAETAQSDFRQPENENDNTTEEDDLAFLKRMTDLPAEALSEVAVSLEDGLADTFDAPVKTKLQELMEQEQHTLQALENEEVGLLDDTPVQAEPEAEPSEPSMLSNIQHKAEEWADGMAHAVKDKVHELEMRAGVLAQEVGDSLKNAETWVENFTDAVADKVEELEIRAEMLAHNAVDSAKEALHLNDHLNDNTETNEDDISIEELNEMLLADLEDLEEFDNNSVPQTEKTQPETTDLAALEAFDDKPVAQTEETQPEITETVATTAVAAAAVAATTALSPAELEADKRGWASRLKAGLTKSRNQMAKSLAGVFGGGKIDEDLYEELETTLLISDMGIEATEQLMKEVRNRVSLKGLKDGAELRAALKEAVYDLLKPLEQPLVLPENGQPFVIMMAGINGAGKTTSIGKLAKYFQAQGKSVMLAAGDTFRAAAREQLQEWGARNGVTVISQASGDSAAVCFDAVESAKAKGIDVVLADTAGRLPTQLHLMEEIKKVKRVLQKAMPDAPHEIMVVLDANIGQNAINQVVAFDDALGITGLIVTKLDGTAKGGVLAALASNRPIPVRYIGVGEGIDDLRPFDARAFVDALLDEADN